MESNHMVIIELSGGLGNQMFQYALGQKLKFIGRDVKYDLSFYSNKEQTARKYKLDLFGIKCPVASERDLALMGQGKSFVNRIKQKFPFVQKKLYIENLDKGYEQIVLELDDIYLSGYWQSEQYFYDIRDHILKLYRLPKTVNVDNCNILKDIERENSVSIHIRRGDYLEGKNSDIYGNICTLMYYTNAIKFINNHLKNPKYYIFTNDIKWARERFSGTDMIVVDNKCSDEDYLDMFLMSKCKANIIANSSFSWWGAWLNQSPNKIVISPQRWFNNHNVTDIICNSWIKIPG